MSGGKVIYAGRPRPPRRVITLDDVTPEQLQAAWDHVLQPGSGKTTAFIDYLRTMHGLPPLETDTSDDEDGDDRPPD